MGKPKFRLDRRTQKKANKRKTKQWQEENLGKFLESKKKWESNNLEAVRQRKEGYRIRNLEKRKISMSNYQKRNPERYRASTHRWRQRNPENIAVAIKNWRLDNPGRLANIRRKWRVLNTIRLARSRRNWYLRNYSKKKKYRVKFFQKNAVVERELFRQRYRIQLLIDSRYFRGNSFALLKSAEVAIEQKFTRSLINEICRKDASKKPSEVALKLETRSLIRKCLNARSQCVKTIGNSIVLLKKQCMKLLQKSEEVRHKNRDICLENVLGVGQHSVSREPFFYEFSYKFAPLTEISQNENEEVACNVFKSNLPPIVLPDKEWSEPEKQWFCEEIKCDIPSSALPRLLDVLRNLEKTKNFRKLIGSGKIDECCNVRHARRADQIRKKTKKNAKGNSYLRMNNDNETVNSDRAIFDGENCAEQNRTKGGHGINCLPNNCSTDFLFLRKIGVHFACIYSLVQQIYAIRRCDAALHEIDSALITGNLASILLIIEKWGSDPSGKQISLSTTDHIPIETALRSVPHANEFLKDISKKPAFACSCCNILYYRTEVKVISIFEDENTHEYKCVSDTCREKNPRGCNDKWYGLIAYLLLKGQDVSRIFVCNSCFSCLNDGGKYPPKSVLNGLDVDEIPQELSDLNDIEKQLIQKAKCFQVVYRLGTVGSKMPASDRVKAQKGQVVYYPLPINETLRTLPQCDEMPSNQNLFIVVYGKPTKNRTVWKSLVDVNKVKKAVSVLKIINPEYASVSVDWDPLRDDIAEDDNEPHPTILEACEQAVKKSRLRRIDKEEEAFILDTYTIQPVHKTRPDKSDLDLFQLERVEAQQIDSREKKLDLWCFPALYPCGKGGEGEERQEKVSNADFIKSRLYNTDPRFRRDHQYIFYLLHKYHLRAIAQGVLQTLRNTYSYNDMSVTEFLRLVNNCEQKLESNLYTVFTQLRGSAEFWSSKKRDLRTMVRELGPPTWFVTLSAAEYDWQDMKDLLVELNADFEGIEKMRGGELCAFDPVMGSRHFHRRFHSFFNKIIRKKGGGALGEIVDWFWRVEYQCRGAPHYHMVVWANGAPRIGKDTPEAVLDFIQKHVTCRLPDKDMEPILNSLVTRYQYHLCNSYCKRKRLVLVNGVKKGFTKCRFSFPREPTEVAILHDPLASIRNRAKGFKQARLYQLPRSKSEERINDYNPELLFLWNANLDVQFVGENTNAVVNYVVSYLTKKEQSALKRIWEEIGQDKALSTRLYNFALRCLSTRECGAYEAVDTILGHRLFGKSRNIKYICARKPHLRPKILKTKKKLEAIENLNPDSKDKYENTWIDTYYPDRPNCMEDLCLYEFRRLYDRESTDEGPLTFRTPGNGRLKIRKKPYLISYPFNKRKEKPEEYCYSLLLLFKPFRDESNELVDSNGSAIPVFDEEMKRNLLLQEHHQKIQDRFEQLERNRNELERPSQENPQSQNREREQEAFDEPFEAANAMVDFNAAMQSDDGETLEGNREKMNEDQRRVFDFIESFLRENELKEKKDQLFMFLSGAGGTGKSFLVNTVKLLSKDIYGSASKSIAVVAPTGLAAYNVNGITLHRLLQLPVQHGKNTRYFPLSDPVCKELYSSLKNLKILVIDEVSMVSNVMLADANTRFNQIFNRGEESLFGGLHLIVMGDLMQLSPVAANPVFRPLTYCEVNERYGGLTTVDLWGRLLTYYDELNISLRQKNDSAFADILNRLRYGHLSEDDIYALQTRLIPIHNLSPEDSMKKLGEYYTDLLKSGKNVVCLVPKSAMVLQFNSFLLSQQENAIIEIPANNDLEFLGRKTNRTVDGALEMLKKREYNVTETAGIEAMLKLSKGARVMLRRNLNVEDGLVNGAVGTITDFMWENDMVKFVRVDFNGLGERDIYRVTVKFALNAGIMVHRHQFPLILAYAMTIHKAQGLSQDHVMTDVGSTVFQDGMTYVALSRAKTLDGLHLINFNPQKANANELSIEEINNLRDKFRPDLPRTSIRPDSEKLRWIPDRIWCKSMTVSKKRAHLEMEPEEEAVESKKRKTRVERGIRSTRKRPLLDSELLEPGMTKIAQVSDGLPVQWPRFMNPNSVSCYANSAIQALFSSAAFREAIDSGAADSLQRELFNLLKQYNARKVSGSRRLNAKKIREKLGLPYSTETQECAFNFMFDLLSNLGKTGLFEFTCERSYRCEQCGSIQKVQGTEFSAEIDVHSMRSTDTFSDMLFRGVWLQDWRCPHCNNRDRSYCSMVPCGVQNYMIIRVIRHRQISGGSFVFDNRAIDMFNGNDINIGDNRMQLRAAIYHVGATRSINEGHYYTIVRTDNNNWVCCNDDNIATLSEFPGSLQNVSIMILEKLT